MRTQADQPQARWVTPRKVIFALSAASFVCLTTVNVALITYEAVVTPSATDPASSEFAVCGPIVIWRVLWKIAWAAFLVPFLLSAMVPHDAGSERWTRARAYAALAAYAWPLLGLVLLAAARTHCADASPHMWAAAVDEVLFSGLPTFSAITTAVLVTVRVFPFLYLHAGCADCNGQLIMQRVRARRAMPVLPIATGHVPEEEGEKGAVAVVVDSKV
ncbi:hypothetical protein BV25DRAFT_1706644 [Artomyces pyxidatus]|uniref:Uncharacterized protein n=1 Tax=Artomyces pyxidatus TaxID=48021 RepID=A0ACB8TBL1_9AGAM|nr:hypothetical protein BV25DRAFT_1706644 [Artomyces pyxidatus]